MAIKSYKPTTPSRRQMTVTDYSELSKVAPEKSLLEPLKKHSGRNSNGRITVRHRGGGNRRKYRVIDFKRDKTEMPAKVLTLEYDPNRSAHIALVQYEDGEKRYIIAPNGLKVGDTVVAGPGADIKPGNSLPMASIPTGTFIHNIELYPGKGAQLARSAGVMAQLMAKENGCALVRLPSGEVRLAEEDLLISTEQTAGYYAVSEYDRTVALDTAITPELKEEGFLREVVSKLQTMRKEGGMEVTDRIRVTFAAAGYAADVLAKNREAIMGEVLAVAFDAGEPAGYVKEWDVNGEPVTFGVEKAARA